MAESRKVQVVLLDDRRLTFNVQPKMYTCDLFDIVGSHFNLKEKEYFGLYYLDETNSQQWLQTDRKVLDHDLPRKNDPILLYFAVRFYIENMCYLQDSVSVELYYLQARHSVYKGVIECDSTTVFELAAYALQVAYENLTNDEQTRDALKKVPVFPTSTLRDHPSIQYCEDQVLKRYYAMNGIMRGQAIISYMSIVEKLPTYGIHYYEVKNKQGIPWWLGLSFKGIAQFDYNDKRTPRRVFPWKYLENLYFRDKKFSIEVHDPKRIVHTLSSFNLYEDAIREPAEECDDLSDAISDPTTQVSVSRRTFGPSNVNVYAWFTNKPQLTKCIWSMAVCQHQFFLDRLQNKSTMMVKRCPNVIADELSIPRTQSLQAMNQSHISLHEPSSHSHRGGSSMDSNKRIHRHNSGGGSRGKLELTPEQKAKQLELYKGLDERKAKLESVLQEKIKELKSLCLKESEVTGELPHEYTLFMSPGEKTPTIKKRMGTAFSIAELVSGKENDLTKLEMEYELQKQILKAKQKLANDETLSKNVRKKHNADYVEAKTKLKELEQNLKSIRTQAGLDAGSFTSEDFAISDSGSFGLRGSDDNASLGSFGSSPALTKSPKKSVSSQQLESLEYSPSTRRRMNSMSRLHNTQKSGLRAAFDIPSNPSSTSSLASISQLEGHSDFTPTKALKYNRSLISQSSTTSSQSSNHPHLPVVHSSADLNSAGSSTANSSTSSLHAYSVSGGRPLRSGSMDDVRLAGSINGNSPHQSQHHQHDRTLQHNGTSSRSKSYLSNNPYGSLERKALKQRRSQNRMGNEAPPMPHPNMYNPYTHGQRADYNYSNTMDTYNRYQTLDYRQSPSRNEDQPPPIPAARVPKPLPPQSQHQPNQPQYRPRANPQRDYAQNVHQASRRMYDNSQPFQMLENPYNTHRRNMEHISHSMSDAHIAPITIDPAPHLPPHRRPSGDRQYHTDSSSELSSPQENAFNFFNNLNNYVQSSVVNNNNPYKQPPPSVGPGSGEGNRHRSHSGYGQEETKPYEMKDFYQYSERLRKARGGVNHGQPPLPAARSSGSRTPSSPGLSLEGSRSGSPYGSGPPPHPGFSNGSSRASPNMNLSSSPHHYANTTMQGYVSNSGTLRNQSRRSMPKDSSFNTGDVADNFSQEMLAWYQDQDPEQTSSTLV